MGKKRSDRRKAYLRNIPSWKCRKCVVCGKALRSENKSGLCSMDYNKESTMNRNNQNEKQRTNKG